MDRTEVGGERLDGGVDVGRLGVVHPGDAADLAHDLQAVGDAGKALQRGGDARGRHAERGRGGGGGQRVGDVVVALQGERGDRAQRGAPLGGPQPERVTGSDAGELAVTAAGVGRHDRRAQRKAAAPAVSGQARGDARGIGVVEVHQGKVGGRLVLEDAQLGVDVAAVAAVAVDVVFGQVEQHRHVGPETLDVLELKARELGHHDRVGGDHAGKAGQSPADVAGHLDGVTGVAQDLPGELGRRGLAVGPGDGYPAIREKPRGELDLAPDRHAAFERRDHHSRARGHAGALDEQLDALGQVGGVAEQQAEPAHAARPAPGRARLRASRRWPRRRRRARATRKQRGRATGTAEADHGQRAQIGDGYGHVPSFLQRLVPSHCPGGLRAAAPRSATACGHAAARRISRPC